MVEDGTVLGLAQANLSEVIGPNAGVTAVCPPIDTNALGTLIAGYEQVQFMTTSCGENLLVGWHAEGQMDVFSLNSQLSPVRIESSSN